MANLSVKCFLRYENPASQKIFSRISKKTGIAKSLNVNVDVDRLEGSVADFASLVLKKFFSGNVRLKKEYLGEKFDKAYKVCFSIDGAPFSLVGNSDDSKDFFEGAETVEMQILRVEAQKKYYVDVCHIKDNEFFGKKIRINFKSNLKCSSLVQEAEEHIPEEAEQTPCALYLFYKDNNITEAIYKSNNIPANAPVLPLWISGLEYVLGPSNPSALEYLSAISDDLWDKKSGTTSLAIGSGDLDALVPAVEVWFWLYLGVVPRVRKLKTNRNMPISKYVPEIIKYWGLGDLEIEFFTGNPELENYKFIGLSTKIHELFKEMDHYIVIVKEAQFISPSSVPEDDFESPPPLPPVRSSTNEEDLGGPKDGQEYHFAFEKSFAQKCGIKTLAKARFKDTDAKKAKIVDARKLIADFLKLPAADHVSLFFSGKALKDGFLLNRLRIGGGKITVYIKDEEAVLLLTAKSR
ncbi:MAG: hypothetical protein LBK29_03770 [Oscillospiraceae bacterium]|jgi:hypothetical protein|nr:hypothetical protein [Oscillospiraceae bacterium]